MPRPAGNETPDAIIAAECLAVRLRVLNRAVTALYDDALRPHGLRVGQLNLLVAVARLGIAKPGDLCRVLCMDKSTLSRDVEVLRRHGWLVADETRGRSRPLRITPVGRALLERVTPAWRQAQAQACTLIGDDGAEAVLAMARRLSNEGTPGL
jgi:DNA-binding MarR family transcriptional regulator